MAHKVIDEQKKYHEWEKISSLAVIIRNYVQCIIDGDSETPDFIVPTANGKFGIEVVDCCHMMRGERGIKAFERSNIERKFCNDVHQNGNFQLATKNNKFNIILDGSNLFYKKRVDRSLAIKEVVLAIKHSIEPELYEKPKPHFFTNIRLIRVPNVNVVQFNHMASRNAITDEDIITTVKKKENVFKGHFPDFPVWINIYLPYEVNLHAYEIDFVTYDRDEYYDILANSPFERIYVTSPISGEVTRLK